MQRSRSELNFPMFMFTDKEKNQEDQVHFIILSAVVRWLTLEKVHCNGEYSQCAFVCLAMSENYLDPQLNRLSPQNCPMETAWVWQVDLENWFGTLYHLFDWLFSYLDHFPIPPLSTV